jgi:hypothetical protein
MAARHWLTVTVALCGALAVTGAEAAAKRAAAQSGYRGCTHFIAPLCMGLTSRRTTYALFGAFIPPGTGADVYGTVSGTGPCGPTLQVTSWKPNKLHCAR